ncbi:hypothetical protein JYT16_01340 [Gemmatimonas aurantiaca]|nr:hypothetical protein [Gemmatimonas aurantiaca]
MNTEESAVRNESTKSRLFRRGFIGVALATILAVPVLFFTGCSINPATSSDMTLQNEESFWDNSFDPASLEPLTTSDALLSPGGYDVYSGEGFISADDGGVVNLEMPGSVHNFTVEAESIPADTVINVGIYVKTSKKSTVILFEFGPDGLVFGESATLSFDISELSSNTDYVDLYWWNPDTGDWEYQRTVRADRDGIVSFPIDHFSMYGVE